MFRKRAPVWYRSIALAGAAVAVVMVPLMEGLQHIHLPLWLHVPLTAVVLGLMSLGAAAAGLAYAEYRARSLADGK